VAGMKSIGGVANQTGSLCVFLNGALVAERRQRRAVRRHAALKLHFCLSQRTGERPVFVSLHILRTPKRLAVYGWRRCGLATCGARYHVWLWFAFFNEGGDRVL